MNQGKVILCVAVSLSGWIASSPTSAHAGPLLDWLLGRRPVTYYRPGILQPAANPFAVNAFSPATGYPVAGSPSCGTCQTTCQQTYQQVVVNYVPHTAYRTAWSQVPVTTYRPVTSVDPVAGCQVTCMRPCTTYRWQAQRVPYTTYRPVYSTQTVQRPVTFTSSSCAPTTLPMQPIPQSQTMLPGTYPGTQLAPNTPLVHADTVPSLTAPPSTPQTTNKPPTGNGGSTNGNGNGNGNGASGDQQSLLRTPSPLQQTSNETPDNSGNSVPRNLPSGVNPITDPDPNLRLDDYNSPPRLLNPLDKTAARGPVHRQWNYSPVKFASHEQPVSPRPDRRAQPTTVNRAQPAKPKNQGWRSVSW